MRLLHLFVASVALLAMACGGQPSSSSAKSSPPGRPATSSTPASYVPSTSDPANSAPSTPDPALLGRWENKSCVVSVGIDGVVWEFQSDGTEIVRAPGEPLEQFHYDQLGPGHIKTTRGSFTATIDYVISGNQMTTYPGTDKSCVFNKF
jgi:hypothetical protein